MEQDRKIIALGFFDGVHLGHQALLRACRDLAADLGATPAALTFATHPDALVMGTAPGLLNTADDRERLLRAYGMEEILVLPFDRATMDTPWQEFFRRLVEEFHAAGLVCGHDFCFGRRGEGRPALLQGACREAGIPCVVVPEQKLEGVTISSTHIRHLLEAGETEEAMRFLGHPHLFSGQVVSGRHLGRRLGFPTANLVMPQGLLTPKLGVYACLVDIGGRKYPAVANIGTRPTVGGHHVTVEPWILDFDGDLYGQTVTLELHKFLRPEQKFPNLEQLQEEIRRNAQQTREFFAKTQKT